MQGGSSLKLPGKQSKRGFPQIRGLLGAPILRTIVYSLSLGNYQDTPQCGVPLLVRLKDLHPT